MENFMNTPHPSGAMTLTNKDKIKRCKQNEHIFNVHLASFILSFYLRVQQLI